MPNTQHAYDDVAAIYFPIAIAVFAAIVVTLAVLLVAGRRRRAPGRQSEAQRVEALYAIGLGAIAAFLVWTTFRNEDPIDRTVARPALTVRVTAAQWSWTFRYANGTTVADVASWNAPAYVPTGVEVEFDATSADVIHGFWVPALHFQRQLFPGYLTRFDLIFATPGRYLGECSVYCGEDHSEMHFAIEAVSDARFQKWLSSHGSST